MIKLLDPVLMTVIVGLWGTIIGSFLNLCIYRLPRGETVIWGSSHCTRCQYQLTALDLVPVISYLWLKGRCRSCGEVISLQYPLVELITAALFMIAYRHSGVSWQTALMWVLMAILIAATVIDWEHKIIPDQLIMVGVLLGIPGTLLISADKLLSGVTGFFAAGLLFLLIAVLSKGGMGGGDIKLSALLGLYLGWPNVLVALFIAFCAGGLFGLIWIVARGGSRKDALPFGPFLALGAIITLFYAHQIVNWYLGLCLL